MVYAVERTQFQVMMPYSRSIAALLANIDEDERILCTVRDVGGKKRRRGFSQSNVALVTAAPTLSTNSPSYTPRAVADTESVQGRVVYGSERLSTHHLSRHLLARRTRRQRSPPQSKHLPLPVHATAFLETVAAAHTGHQLVCRPRLIQGCAACCCRPRIHSRRSAALVTQQRSQAGLQYLSDA